MIEIVYITCIWDMEKEKEIFEKYEKENPTVKINNIHDKKITTESYVVYEIKEENENV